MRSEMETSNGLFQQQNQTQMAVDNDITMFTQTTHMQQNTTNNNMGTNTAIMINNNETMAVGGGGAVAVTTAAVASMPALTVNSGTNTVVAHEVTPTHIPPPPLATPNRLHTVLSSSSGVVGVPTLAQSTLSSSASSSHLKSNHQQLQQQTQAAQDPASLTKILTKTRLQELVREVDATEQLDDDVEEILLQLADDFVETTVTAACLLAKHRKATTVEVKDVQLHLERNWNMWIPGFGTDELRPYKRSAVTEAHKQRLALIRKTLKKY